MGSEGDAARLLAEARESFARDGFEAAAIDAIAKVAGVPLAQALLLFPSKYALAHALYQGVVADTLSIVADLEAGSVAARFAALLEAKLDRLDAQRDVMRALLSVAMDARGDAGVLSSKAAALRARTAGAILTAVVGADDAPANASELGALLYGLHLAVVLLWTQDEDGKMARGVVTLARDLLGQAAPMLALPFVSEAMHRLGAIFGDRLAPVVSADVERRARWILARLMHGRRLAPGEADGAPAEVELAPHLPLVRAALSEDRPLELLLPAFPAKSPSPAKVLGKLPDYAESIALRSRDDRCRGRATAACAVRS
ncbi:MAG: L-tyrosine/L-tryptophan isonitrile synthase family protein [Labilithrix sp.]|nr:L-tyrosine/L-tryptophan isonitrile synthase family protein [Labilithrix sp.]MCW5816063.1 L-tyrosine/L-tryptophan isonitrile synthase family protein [Labilithrix sp.]